MVSFVFIIKALPLDMESLDMFKSSANKLILMPIVLIFNGLISHPGHSGLPETVSKYNISLKK